MLWTIIGHVSDVVSVIAGIIAIVGVPVLWVSTRKLLWEVRESREIKIVSQGCLEFSDANSGINLVPLEMVTGVPRPGDTVYLPGETRDFHNYGGGVYEVKDVAFSYLEAPGVDQPCPAKLSKVIARVRKKQPTRSAYAPPGV